jgi:hypothetical protein
MSKPISHRFTTTVDEERRLTAFQAVGLIAPPPDSRLLAAQAVALEMGTWDKESVSQQVMLEALFSACTASDSVEAAILRARRTISFLQTGEVDLPAAGGL